MKTVFSGAKSGIAIATCGLAIIILAGIVPVHVFAQGDNAKALTLVAGEIREVAVPFKVETYRAGNSGIVQVETIGQQKLRIVGKQPGSTDLQVMGDGEASALYSITVVPNIEEVLRAVKADLDQIPEVEASVSLGKVVLRGEINSPEHWKQFKRIIKSYDSEGGGKVLQDRTSLSLPPEMTIRLKKALEEAGFKVLDKGQKAENGAALTLSFNDNNIMVRGAVYSPNDIRKIESAALSLEWLTLKPKDGASNDENVYVALDVSVIPTILEVDVAFVGVTDKEEDQWGVNLAKKGLLFVQASANAAQSWVRGQGYTHGAQSSFAVGSDLAGTLQFFAGSGPGRAQSRGHLSFKSNADGWQTFQSGGTIFARTQGTTGGGDMKPIEYGLVLKAKGGLQNAETATLDLDLELSTPIPIGTDYDLKKSHVTTTVSCPIGKTLVLAGTKELFESASSDGVPILRNVPVLGWLFSEKTKKMENRKLLIMISPQLAPDPTAAAPLSAETVSAIEDADTPVSERAKKK